MLRFKSTQLREDYTDSGILRFPWYMIGLPFNHYLYYLGWMLLVKFWQPEPTAADNNIGQVSLQVCVS